MNATWICLLSQTLSEKTKELEKVRSEWTTQSSSLSSRHFEELQLEREKVAEVRLTCPQVFIRPSEAGCIMEPSLSLRDF